MKILLVGEYSNVHWTLAEGLRALGHQVNVVSDGDCWKDYPRDINLKRKSLGIIDTLKYLWDIRQIMPQLRGYDVVQLINPVFLDLKGERILPYYKQLRKQNKKVFLGAFGVDKYWVQEGLKPETFRYSDFYLFGERRDYPYLHDMERDWLNGSKGELNQYIADDCNGIIAGLYEYERCYRDYYKEKLTYIPFPIDLSKTTRVQGHPEYDGIRFFIGIQKERSAYKGTDIMLAALTRLKEEFPEKMEIVKAESVPFAQYQEMMNRSDVMLDQLYSYTPGMNGLLAMSKGMVLAGGAEEEFYQLQGEKTLRPIINVQPTEDDVVKQIRELLLLHPENLEQMQQDSIKFIERWHSHTLVAKQYINFWNEH